MKKIKYIDCPNCKGNGIKWSELSGSEYYCPVCRGAKKIPADTRQKTIKPSENYNYYLLPSQRS